MSCIKNIKSFVTKTINGFSVQTEVEVEPINNQNIKIREDELASIIRNNIMYALKDEIVKDLDTKSLLTEDLLSHLRSGVIEKLYERLSDDRELRDMAETLVWKHKNEITNKLDFVDLNQKIQTLLNQKIADKLFGRY
jgi:hypothetical protein